MPLLTLPGVSAISEASEARDEIRRLVAPPEKPASRRDASAVLAPPGGTHFPGRRVLRSLRDRESFCGRTRRLATPR